MGNSLNDGKIESHLEEDTENEHLEEENLEDEDNEDSEEEPIKENSSNLNTAISNYLSTDHSMTKYKEDLKARIEKGPQMESAFTLKDLKDIGTAALCGGGAFTLIPGVDALYGSLIAATYVVLKKAYRNLKDQE